VLQALTTVPEPASSTPAPAVPHLPAAAQGPAATPARPWEASTLRLNKGDVTVFQTLSPAVARQPACLILYSGEDAGKRFPLENLVLTIGRSPECPVWVDHPGISRCHAELLRDADGYILRDLASSNGTHLNGQRLELPTRLHDGDLIRLGKVSLKYYEGHSLDALMHDRIYRMATVDAGTDVHTKRYLMEALERELKRARRNEHPLCVLCIDLDHFKLVNDQYGHDAGDQVLRQVAARVQQQVRGSDILGRIGGEEFAVVLPETDLPAAIDLAERMRLALAAQGHALELRDQQGGRTVQHRQTASFGVARLEPEMADARALLAAADLQLYSAKRNGRDRVSS
jgi:two-component system cell cycle response regulator